MRTNLRGSLPATILLVGCAASVVVGCGNPGNSEPSFRLNLQNQDPDEYREVGGEDEAVKKDKQLNIEGRKYVVDALEAMFGTPDRPYVFPESGLDLAKIFQASGPVGGMPEAERDAQVLKLRQKELELRPKIKPLQDAVAAADKELVARQEPAKPVQARLTAAKKALADAETAKNQTAIDEQKRQIATIQAELKPLEEKIAPAQEAKAKADGELAAVNGQLSDVMRQIGMWQQKQKGLYRQHCSHCHGTTGDGAGPTALFLTPYPRDYRQGIFKFKSTERSAKPTHDDLRRILVDGIPDSAMPTVGLLPSDEIDALVEYVKYLSMRGEAETALRARWYDDRKPMAASRAELIKVALQPVVDSWKEAEGQVIKPGTPYKTAYDGWKQEEVKRYREELKNQKAAGADTAELSDQEFHTRWLKGAADLFAGQKGQCFSCHGPTGLGDGRKRTEPLFDDWNKPKQITKTKDQIKALTDGGKADEAARLQRIMASWQLPEQQQFPRNLRLGRFRFGRAPVDLYRRVHAGITGTEMPGGGPPAPGQQAKLTPTEIWQLVDYVLLLPYLDASERLMPTGEHGTDGKHVPAAGAPAAGHAAAESTHTTSAGGGE
jgi:mono/diheme cytochrome c family protein